MTNEPKLASLLAFVEADGRVCPMPSEWNRLWNMLPECPPRAGDREPWPPLILSGWWASNDAEKATRLAYHIQWASDHGALERVDSFLRRLPIESWHQSKSS
jgi:hypothetical protein